MGGCAKPDPAKFTGRTSNTVALATKTTAASRLTPVAGDFVDVLSVVAEKPRSRTINAFSSLNNPYDLSVQWNSGGGESGTIVVTSMGGRIRFSLFASTIFIRAANWGPLAHSVTVNVDDGYTVGNNLLQRVVRNVDLTSAAAQRHRVPAFARTAKVMATSNLDDIRLDLVLEADDAGVTQLTVASYTGSGADPIPVGDVRAINVNMLVAGTVDTAGLVFDLGF